MPIFMKAGSIQGDVVAESHRGWVEVSSCSFELSFEDDDVRKSTSEGAPLPKDLFFEVGKTNSDRAGPALMQWMIDGDKLDTVQVDVCGDTLWQGNWRCHVRYLLKGVLLTDYSVSVTDAEQGKSSIKMTLGYDELSVEHLSYAKGSAQRTTSKAIAVKRPE